MQVLQETFGFEDERLWTAASGFGGGIARYQSICGALSGGVMALGLLEGRKAQDLSSGKVSEPVRLKARRLLDRFKEQFGAVECGGLMEHDFNVPGGYEAHKASPTEKAKCNGYVKFVVETLASEDGR